MQAANFVAHAALIASMLLLAGLPSAASEPVAAGDKLRAAAKKAWVEYETAARRWSVQTHITGQISAPGKPPQTVTGAATIRSNDALFAIEETDGTSPGDDPDTKPKSCRVLGREYQFEARQSPGHADWAMTQFRENVVVRKAVSNKLLSERMATLDRETAEVEHLLAAVTIDTIRASRLIDHPCCRTESFGPDPAGPATGLIEWRFTTDLEKKPEGMREVLSGRVRLRPRDGWVIDSYQIDNRNGQGGISTIRKTFRYHTGRTGHPRPSEVQTELMTDDRTYSASAVTTFTLLPDAATAETFTLAAYGIPEEVRGQSIEQLGSESGSSTPAQQSSAEEPVPVWPGRLLLFGGLLIASGVALKVYLNRRQARRSPTD